MRCIGRVWAHGALQLRDWVAQDLGALCALATEVRSRHHVAEWAPHFTRVTRWDLDGCALSSSDLQALLRAPSLRHVQAINLDLSQDHSQQRCQWEALEVRRLDCVGELLRVPSGVGRVVVAERLTLRTLDQQQMAAVLQRWGAPGQLRVKVDTPPSDATVKRWCLSEEEAQEGFFALEVQSAAVGGSHAALLRSTVLPQGGGPCTLALTLGEDCPVAPTLQQLAPLLAGTRVRTLCVGVSQESGPVRGILSALPASITRARLHFGVHQARAVLSGPAATHALRLVVLLRCGGQFAEQQRKLQKLCAAHQPLVRLEVVFTD